MKIYIYSIIAMQERSIKRKKHSSTLLVGHLAWFSIVSLLVHALRNALTRHNVTYIERARTHVISQLIRNRTEASPRGFWTRRQCELICIIAFMERRPDADVTNCSYDCFALRSILTLKYAIQTLLGKTNEASYVLMLYVTELVKRSRFKIRLSSINC